MEVAESIQTVKPADTVTLTERQADVLPLIITGKSYEEIAKTLFRGKSRTRQVGYQIFKKFGVNSREKLIERAVKRGLIYLDNNGNKRGVKLNFIEKLFVDASKESSDQGDSLQGTEIQTA